MYGVHPCSDWMGLIRVTAGGVCVGGRYFLLLLLLHFSGRGESWLYRSWKLNGIFHSLSLFSYKPLAAGSRCLCQTSCLLPCCLCQTSCLLSVSDLLFAVCVRTPAFCLCQTSFLVSVSELLLAVCVRTPPSYITSVSDPLLAVCVRPPACYVKPPACCLC